MIYCTKCKRQTEEGEPTGTLRKMEELEIGKRIVSSIIVCVSCSGEEK